MRLEVKQTNPCFKIWEKQGCLAAVDVQSEGKTGHAEVGVGRERYW